MNIPKCCACACDAEYLVQVACFTIEPRCEFASGEYYLCRNCADKVAKNGSNAVIPPSVGKRPGKA
jgi:hypothetical protein